MTLLGGFLAALGLASNEWILRWLVDAPPPLPGGVRAAIWAFDLACLATGACLLVRHRQLAARWSRHGREATLGGWTLRHPRLVAAVLGLAVATALVVGMERTAHVLLNARPARRFSGGYTHSFFQRDSRLGYRPSPNRAVDSSLSIDGRTVYAVTYTIDGRSRRVTPRPLAVPSRISLAFFGCSYVFGEGVEDHETLPAQVVRRAPSCAAFNYGFSGYGPQHMLEQITAEDFQAGLDPPRAMAVYLFLDDHVRRAIGAMTVAASWGANFPCYQLDVDGRPRRLGTFASARPHRQAVYRWLLSHQLVQWTGVDLPLVVRDAHLDLTAALVAAAANRFAEQHGPHSFVVVLYPGDRYGGDLARRLESSSSVLILDLRGLFDPSDPQLVRPEDNHPTPRGHELVAKAMVRALPLAAPPPDGEPGAQQGARDLEEPH